MSEIIDRCRSVLKKTPDDPPTRRPDAVSTITTTPRSHLDSHTPAMLRIAADRHAPRLCFACGQCVVNHLPTTRATLLFTARSVGSLSEWAVGADEASTSPRRPVLLLAPTRSASTARGPSFPLSWLVVVSPMKYPPTPSPPNQTNPAVLSSDASTRAHGLANDYCCCGKFETLACP